MEPMTLGELLEATGGTLLGSDIPEDAHITSVEIDSRKVGPGALFVALRGENTDGHRYLTPAMQAGGAGCLVMDEPAELVPGRFYIQVPDTVRAIGQVARAYKSRFPIPVVGITGSVGKTTAKDMIASVLGVKYRVLKTEGNYNNELGLPLTLFRLSPQDEICVLEMGMDRPDDLIDLTQIVVPDIAVITNVDDVHIEKLGSRENIFRAKAKIFTYMQPGTAAVLNGDDPLLRTLEGKIASDIVFCGGRQDYAYSAAVLEQNGIEGIRCSVKTPKAAFTADVPALGGHMIYPITEACAVAERLGLSTEEIREGIARFVPTRMRMNVSEQGGVTILDDAYNASPQSVRAALDVLSDMDAGCRIAILGDMFELGTHAPELHADMGRYAAEKGNIDVLIAVGGLSRSTCEAAGGIAKVLHAADTEAAKAMLPELVGPGAAILVKASRGMALEKLTDEIRRLATEG